MEPWLLSPAPCSAAPGSLGLERLQAALARRGFEVAVFPWPAAGSRLLRVSAQVYNRREQYARLAEALHACLAEEGNPR